MRAVRVVWFTDVLPAAARGHLGLPPAPGPQAWVDRLAAELGRRGAVDLTVAAPWPRPFPAFMSGGVRFVGLPATPPPASRWRRVLDGWRHRIDDPLTLAGARRLVRETRPDVVHVHGTEGVCALLVPRVEGVPCVVSLQGLLGQYRRFYFAGRTAGDLVRLALSPETLKGRGELHGYARLAAKARREAWVLRAGRWFIGRTNWDRAALAAANPGARYFHCDELLREPFHAVDWADGAHRGDRLYCTSSTMLFKGGETLIAALALLRRAGHAGLRLRLAGVPPASEVGRLYRAAARAGGVADAVDWLGRLDGAAIAAEIAAADVFVYPSHVDNSPNALAEAMLVGAPIVATFAGGIPSLLRHGEEGLLVPRGDAVALAHAVATLLADRDLARRLGAAARRRARQRHDPGRVVARLLDIYAEVAGEHGD